MIKKILGVVVAAVAIAVIVVAVMHRGKYSSAVFNEPEAEAVFDATAEDGSTAGTELRYAPETDGCDAAVCPVYGDAPDSVKSVDSLHKETGVK